MCVCTLVRVLSASILYNIQKGEQEGVVILHDKEGWN